MGTRQYSTYLNRAIQLAQAPKAFRTRKTNGAEAAVFMVQRISPSARTLASHEQAV
jgi:hypothetical protein